jgi:hypothetical protein
MANKSDLAQFTVALLNVAKTTTGDLEPRGHFLRRVITQATITGHLLKQSKQCLVKARTLCSFDLIPFHK